MQQDHVESRNEESSAGARIRGKVSPEPTSQARTILNLQNAVGNRAMARILGAPATMGRVPRTPLGAVSVQRDELTDAIQAEIGHGRVVDYKSLARVLVRTWQGAEKESSPGEPKKATVTEKSKEKSGTGTSSLKTKKTKSGMKAPLTKDDVTKKREAVEALEKRLQEGPSALERESEALDVRQARAELRQMGKKKTWRERDLEQIEALKKEKTESEALRKEEEELRRPKTAGEKANLAKRQELDELKKRQTANEDRLKKRQEVADLNRKLSGRLTLTERADRDLDDQLADLKEQQEEAEKMRKWERQRKPLNPQGKSLSQLMAGPRVWRG